jgi:hypothetical protein
MTVPLPRTLAAQRRRAWEAACVAYRKQRCDGYGDLEAFRAALAALQMVWPLPDGEAAIEARTAITYASKRDFPWMWRGVRGKRLRVDRVEK